MKPMISTFTLAALLSALYSVSIGCSGNPDEERLGFEGEVELDEGAPAAALEDALLDESEADMEGATEGEVIDKLANRGGTGAGASKPCCCPGSTTKCTECTSRQTCGWTGQGDSCTPKCLSTMHPGFSSVLSTIP